MSPRIDGTGPVFSSNSRRFNLLSRSMSKLSQTTPLLVELLVHKHHISMFEQIIPLGSVGYIDGLTRIFVVLFSAICPASSTDHEFIIQIFPVPDYEYKKSVILRRLGAWTKERSVYTIPLGFDMAKMLFLALGRAYSPELVGDCFDFPDQVVL
ncbi:uncharacterized protein BT62DRAFT_1006239 [Guyanagaster necrorhizus]|uniref:Uncharacterized protein n=1 Tax=Guyanagaster necrorhizus TaxID=856835 RepID=A0A9P7VSJ8_9AGAR|nr:uncharacterized protein BT62DRAFT_1006239 [Guyanagaster necrorhizus MCA 3950]KAG7446057.1 hypothetical protein BT62DRAFT_1006239 [Guyanagaster necrorhizus MCA 3950]